MRSFVKRNHRETRRTSGQEDLQGRAPSSVTVLSKLVKIKGERADQNMRKELRDNFNYFNFFNVN